MCVFRLFVFGFADILLRLQTHPCGVHSILHCNPIQLTYLLRIKEYGTICFFPHPQAYNIKTGHKIVVTWAGIDFVLDLLFTQRASIDLATARAAHALMLTRHQRDVRLRTPAHSARKPHPLQRLFKLATPPPLCTGHAQGLQ